MKEMTILDNSNKLHQGITIGTEQWQILATERETSVCPDQPGVDQGIISLFHLHSVSRKILFQLVNQYESSPRSTSV
jgi:hypothetical protein